MPPYVSAPDVLALHGPRVLGFASAARVAARYRLDVDVVHEFLLDFEATGWVRHSSFAGSSGWSVTEAGRTEDERRLAIELDQADARDIAVTVHTRFVPLNRRLTHACTDWQIRPTRLDPMATNDHTDWSWDERVLRTLASVDREFRQLADQLEERLQRFAGYADRYSSALAQVDVGGRRWVDAPDIDSCHTVWIQFHEDLLATLGLPRGSDA
jgi:hypothetical protein